MWLSKGGGWTCPSVLTLSIISIAVLPLTILAVEIITEPKPGQEYVKIQAANKQQQHSIKESKSVVMSVSSSKSSSFRPARASAHPEPIEIPHQPRQYHHDVHYSSHHHDLHPAVEVTEEGRTGLYNSHPDAIEKAVLEAKADQRLASKKEQYNHKKEPKYSKEIEVRDSGNLGVKKPEVKLGPGDLGLPKQKNIHPETHETYSNYKQDLDKKASKYEIVGVSSTKGKYKQDDGAFDFVDTPLSDKVLTPAGSSQASRINVKKGPNGQDYEYEYVYYYYDDDDEPAQKKDDVKVTEAPKKPEVVQTPSPIQQNTRFVTPINEQENAARGFSDHDDQFVNKGRLSDDKSHSQNHVTHASLIEQAQQIPHDHPHLVSHTLTHEPIAPQVHEHHDERHYTESHTAAPHIRPTPFHEPEQPRREPTRSRQPIDQDGEYGTARGRTEQRQQFERQPPQQFAERPQQQFERQPQYDRTHYQEAPGRTTAPEHTRTRHPEHSEPENDFASGRGRSRYQERGRVSEPVVVTTQEPVQNEVIPSRTHHRGRGRGQSAAAPVEEDSSEERGQRFQSRTRVQESTTTKPKAAPQHVRRPSLELVDSSSFRTHASDLPPQQDIPTEYNQPSRGVVSTRTRGYVEDTRESDLPEYIDEIPQRGRPTPTSARGNNQGRVPTPTVTSPVQRPVVQSPAVTTVRYRDEEELEHHHQGVHGVEVDNPSIQSGRPIQQHHEEVVPTRGGSPQSQYPSQQSPGDEGIMPEKAALDLYALLQSHEAENSANEVETEPTEEILTEAPTTTTTTTSTTTTTTTQPPPTQRGRFRGGARTRTRTTQQPQSTEAPAQEPRTRGRFQPSRPSSSGSLSGGFGGRTRSGFKQTTPTPSAASEEVSEVTQRSRPSFSANRFRTRTRPGGPSSAAPQPSTEQEPVETTARPTRPRANPSVRPLRPGPRINIAGARPVSASPRPESTPVEVPQQIPVEDEPIQNGEAVEVSTDSALTRLRNRPRLRISAAAPRPAATGPATAQARRPLPHGLAGRRRPADAEAEEQTHHEEEILAADIQQPADIEDEPQPSPSPSTPPESRLNSLIKRRRPLPGGLHRPVPHPQDN